MDFSVSTVKAKKSSSFGNNTSSKWSVNRSEGNLLFEL
jgi:hypothetical protein